MKTFIKSLIFVCSLCTLSTVYAQKEFKGSTVDNSLYAAKVKTVKDYEIFDVNTKELHEYLKEIKKPTKIKLLLGNKKIFNLTLEKNEIRTPSCRSILTTDNGEILDPNVAEIITYKGYLDDDFQQWVRLIVTEDRLEGFFNSKNDPFAVESLKNFTKSNDENRIVTYKASTQEFQGICGVDLMKQPKEVKGGRQSATKSSLEAVCRVLEVATDADFEFFQRWGASYSNQRILNFLNTVEGVYQSTFQLRVVVVFQNVYTTAADPYTIDGVDGSGNTAADELRDFWNTNRTNVARDLAHLFSGKNHNVNGGQLFGSIPVVSGVGQFGAICANPNQSYSFTTDRSNGYLSTAHEIGHNFNAQHSNGSGCCGAGQTDISQCPNASIMCQGPKKDPMFFNSTEQSVISTHINNNGGCLGNNSTITITGAEINGGAYNGGSYNACGTIVLHINAFYASNYTWQVDDSDTGNGSLTQNGSFCYATLNGNGSFAVTVYLSNECGSNSYTFYLYPCSGGRLSAENTGDVNKVTLSQAYPNPLNQNTRIDYALPRQSQISLEVFNTLGKKITTLDSGIKPAGNHSVIFSGNDLPSGNYFYRLVVGDWSETKKIIISK